ncbi:hypothetical protein G7034_07210 [Psychroflexus sp. C1]|uniref:Uncharacterized protein n=2 Tax=Psychroflexus maritimus TaxID=2714865 RepID=A0A967DYP4_9FLAO|nr:hypothetical protein [Psychroflexus maritimus]
MLTKFFRQSKPIVLFFLILLSWVAYLVQVLSYNKESLGLKNSIINTGLITLIIFLQNFIIRKNKINQQNSFGISLFTLGLISLIPLFEDTTSWLVLLFIGLFFRRLISMLNETLLKKKTFEASAWLIIASFFEPNFILLLLLIWLANLILSVNQFANYLIPIITLGGAIILANAVTIILYGEYFKLQEYVATISLDLSWYFTPNFLYILVLLIICIVSFPGFLQKAQVLKKIQLNLLLISVLSVSAIVSFLEVGTPAFYAICLFPLSPIAAEFFQLRLKKWIHELVWILLISLSLFTYINQYI